MGPYMQAEATNTMEENANRPSNRAMGKQAQREFNGGVHWARSEGEG